MTTLSKAAQKRQEETKRFLKARLTQSLIDFQNKFYQDYSDWKIMQIEFQLQNVKNSDEKYINGWTKEKLVKNIEIRLSRRALLNQEFLSEAKDLYYNRIDRLVEKLMSFGFSGYDFKVEYIRTDFSFLITNNRDGSIVHARTIYANGDIKAPHYRFITTQRK